MEYTGGPRSLYCTKQTNIVAGVGGFPQNILPLMNVSIPGPHGRTGECQTHHDKLNEVEIKGIFWVDVTKSN